MWGLPAYWAFDLVRLGFYTTDNKVEKLCYCSPFIFNFRARERRDGPGVPGAPSEARGPEAADDGETATGSSTSGYRAVAPDVKSSYDAAERRKRMIQARQSKIWCRSILKDVIAQTTYNVCRGLRRTTRDNYFWVTFDHFWSEHHFLKLLRWASSRNWLKPKPTIRTQV